MFQAYLFEMFLQSSNPVLFGSFEEASIRQAAKIGNVRGANLCMIVVSIGHVLRARRSVSTRNVDNLTILCSRHLGGRSSEVFAGLMLSVLHQAIPKSRYMTCDLSTCATSSGLCDDVEALQCC
jgi:DNA repair protein RadC